MDRYGTDEHRHERTAAQGGHPIEHKFDVPPGITPPDLSDLAAVATVTAPFEINFETTYFDTEDLRLAARGIAVRRRAGGKDQGWHLKFRTIDGRRSDSWLPLGGRKTVPPEALAREVRAVARGHELTPVALVRTTRVQRRLLDRRGEALALLSDDTVRGDLLGATANRSAWREIDIELVHPGDSLLDALCARLESAGLVRARHICKIERVLGQRFRLPSPPEPPGRHATMGELLLVYLRRQVDELIEGDRAARCSGPDAVHRMRMATRRMREVLATFRPLLTDSRVDALREELGWLGRTMAQPRDTEVLLDRLHGLLDTQPVELVAGPARQHIDGTVADTHRRGRDLLLAALDHGRYLQLLDDLEALLASPPLAKRARRPAAREMSEYLARTLRRVSAAAGAADRAVSPADRVRRLHEVRTAVKRARYAAECAEPVIGRRATKLVGRMREVQEILGEHRDSVLARALLRELGRRAHESGDDGFIYGLLHGLEHGRGEAADQLYRRALREALR